MSTLLHEGKDDMVQGIATTGGFSPGPKRLGRLFGHEDPGAEPDRGGRVETGEKYLNMIISTCWDSKQVL